MLPTPPGTARNNSLYLRRSEVDERQHFGSDGRASRQYSIRRNLRLSDPGFCSFFANPASVDSGTRCAHHRPSPWPNPFQQLHMSREWPPSSKKLSSGRPDRFAATLPDGCQGRFGSILWRLILATGIGVRGGSRERTSIRLPCWSRETSSVSRARWAPCARGADHADNRVSGHQPQLHCPRLWIVCVDDSSVPSDLIAEGTR